MNTNNPSEIFDVSGRRFYFRPAPHLTEDQDWHTAYIEIIHRILEDVKTRDALIELPAYPLLSALCCEDLLFEMGSYWEGALYSLSRIVDEPTSLSRLRFLEYSVANGYGTLEEFLFLEIWNSHGQLKWLKAHLIREEKQGLLEGGQELRAFAERHGDEDLIWLAHFVEQHQEEGGKYPNPYFGGSNPLHLGPSPKGQNNMLFLANMLSFHVTV